MLLANFKDLITNMPVSYQAFTSKRKTWQLHIGKDNEAGRALRSIFQDSKGGALDMVTLSRSDLRCLGNKQNLAEFVMATIVWGYPRGMRGNHVGNMMGDVNLLTKLLIDARLNAVPNWKNHYANVNQINGIGLSTYTKFLSFLDVQVEGHTALILDDRIIRVVSQCVFEELRPLQKLNNNSAANSYPEYLKVISDVAMQLNVSAESMELFLFEFGLSMKQPLPCHNERSR